MSRKIKNTAIIFILLIILSGCEDKYKRGINQFNKNNYDVAREYFKGVNQNDKNFKMAQLKIIEIDSIKEKQKFEEEQKAEIEKIENEKKKVENSKEQFKREIESIKNFDGNKYRDDVTSIQTELIIFGAWAKIIKEADDYKDKEISELAKAFKTKVINLQKSEFPKLRKNYGSILKAKLWAEDIEVYTKGSNYTTLEFIGGIFASNKSKMEFQNTLHDILNQLRFKRVNYKWYKYDDNYSYYALDTEQDGSLFEP